LDGDLAWRSLSVGETSDQAIGAYHPDGDGLVLLNPARSDERLRLADADLVRVETDSSPFGAGQTRTLSTVIVPAAQNVLDVAGREGGVDRPDPYYSVYGHSGWGGPTALVELSPPSGLNSLQVGDYVETEVEMIVVPQAASDYSGPNQNLRNALSADPRGWRFAYREATGNDLAVTAETGTIEQTFPVRIRAEQGSKAEFEITGGIAYVPVTIVGVKDYSNFTLKLDSGAGFQDVDQSNFGNDWWQTAYDTTTNEWELTFTLPLDSPDDQRQTRRLLWELNPPTNNAVALWLVY
jgi:hypothetical protein